MAQGTNRTPSEQLRINEHVTRKYGIDGWHTCYLFDEAVLTFGNYVESKLATYKDGKPKYTLRQLLGNHKSKMQPQQATRMKRGDARVSAVKPRVVSNGQ